MSAPALIGLLLAPATLPDSGGIDNAYFSVEFLQHNNVVPVQDGSVMLDKEPFVIRVGLKGGQAGITVSASFDTDYFDAGATGEIPDYVNLPPKTMVEPNFNSDRTLLVDSELVCYWFYDGAMGWHRFDPQVMVEEDLIVATKSVDSLDVVATRRSIHVKETDRPLYLFFLAQGEVPRGVVAPELARARVMIAWR